MNPKKSRVLHDLEMLCEEMPDLCRNGSVTDIALLLIADRLELLTGEVKKIMFIGEDQVEHEIT